LQTRCGTITARLEEEEEPPWAGNFSRSCPSSHSRCCIIGRKRGESSNSNMRLPCIKCPIGAFSRQSIQVPMNSWNRGGGSKSLCAARQRRGFSFSVCLKAPSLQLPTPGSSAAAHLLAASSASSSLSRLDHARLCLGVVRDKSSTQRKEAKAKVSPGASTSQGLGIRGRFLASSACCAS